MEGVREEKDLQSYRRWPRHIDVRVLIHLFFFAGVVIA